MEEMILNMKMTALVLELMAKGVDEDTMVKECVKLLRENGIEITEEEFRKNMK